MDHVALDVEVAAAGMRTIRRLTGVLGTLAAAAAVVGFVGLLVTPEEGAAERLFTVFAVLFIVLGPVAVLLILLHSAAHDLHLRRRRAAARRQLAPGSPAGHAAAVLYTNWWQRAVGAPARHAPTIEGVSQGHGPYDPDQDPVRVVQDSAVLPPSVDDAWRRNPRRLAKTTAASAGLAAVVTLLVSLTSDGSWLLITGAVLGALGMGLYVWARQHDLGRRRQDIRELARLLEQMRTDPAYGAHPQPPMPLRVPAAGRRELPMLRRGLARLS